MQFTYALICQGVADAVGYPLEFGTPTRDDVLKSMDRHRLLISDDTQMTLFTTQALTNLLTRHGMDFTLQQASDEFTAQYLDWYRTQIGEYAPRSKGLLKHQQLFNRQAPGNACLGSLSALSRGESQTKFASTRFGCGAVMRLLPIAYMAGASDGAVLTDLIIESMHVTHQSPKLLTVVRRYVKAVSAARTTGSVGGSIAPVGSLGGGWYADECLEMALASVEQADSYTDMLVHSIAHPGDSDSVAAVAGSFWGMASRPAEVLVDLAPKLAELDVLLEVAYDFEQALTGVGL